MNASTTKTIIVFRSCTMHPQSPPLTIGGTVLKESTDPDLDISNIYCSLTTLIY